MIAKNLKYLRLKHGFSQDFIADYTGKKSFTTVQKWESGVSDPSIEVASKLANLYNVSLDDLYYSDLEKEAAKPQATKSKGIRIPVLGRIAAGVPIDAVQEILDYEEITPEMNSMGEYFALKIHGASMEPRMVEGDVVIVRKQDDVESGDVAIVLINGNDATVKRVKKQKDGITLIATNTSVYEPHYYSNEEIATLPIKILGKVVELRAKF
ncbi:LexA family protein [Acidaminococcus intestini]|uniref:LexA family protein n=1 Tax=Acidaminococcus intestini TaxID=187327 RepID=UPI00265E4CEC|nr:S24 family peptidase [Acidaminococcus intestini]